MSIANSIRAQIPPIHPEGYPFIGGFALASLITTPVVASTRLFCRYTGVEIVGCAEQQVSNHRAIRGESCCVRRTVQPLDAARPASDERFEPAALAVAVPLADWVPQSAVRRFVFTVRTVGSGPPAFLSHRALLI